MTKLQDLSYLQNLIISNALSFTLGVLGSYLVWWLLNHKWIPQIRFGKEICRYTIDDNSRLYVCALENAGKRDILDLSVSVRIGVKKFDEAESWIHFSLKTNSSQIPMLNPGRRALVRVFDQREKPSFIDAPTPKLLKEILKCESLEEIFQLSTEVEVKVHVFGYDSYSGVRRQYASPSYTRKDIRSGRLKGLVVVQPRSS